MEQAGYQWSMLCSYSASRPKIEWRKVDLGFTRSKNRSAARTLLERGMEWLLWISNWPEGRKGCCAGGQPKNRLTGSGLTSDGEILYAVRSPEIPPSSSWNESHHISLYRAVITSRRSPLHFSARLFQNCRRAGSRGVASFLHFLSSLIGC